MRQITQAFVDLPITGWFSDPERKYRHDIPERPQVELDDLVKDAFTTNPPRPFKSFLVETLGRVRDGDGVPMSANFDAGDWAEAEGLIEPLAFKKDMLYAGTAVYRLTAKGEEFMRQHEAPEAWL